MYYSNMKKLIFVISAVVLSCVSSFLAVKMFRVYNSDNLIRENIEALSDGEVIVGPLCAYDPGHWCFYIYPDNTKETVEGSYGK